MTNPAPITSSQAEARAPKFFKLTLGRVGFIILGLSVVFTLILIGGNKLLSLASLLFSTYVQASLAWAIAACILLGLIVIAISILRWFIVNPTNLSSGTAITGGIVTALLSLVAIAFTGLYLLIFLAFGPGDFGKLITYQDKQYFAVQTNWLDPDRYSCYEAHGSFLMSNQPQILDYYEIFDQKTLDAE